MILPQANDGANAIHVESGLAVEEDFSSDKVDNDNITVANGHNLHGQTAVIEMARADDLRVGDVHAAGQASVGNVEQVDLIRMRRAAAGARGAASAEPVFAKRSPLPEWPRRHRRATDAPWKGVHLERGSEAWQVWLEQAMP